MNHIEMMRLAERVAQGSRCPERQVGAVLVSGVHGRRMQAGNSAACDDTNANHAESKLVVMARDARWSLVGATIYTTCRPCARCTAMLLPLGLKAIYYRDDRPEMGHLQWLRAHGVEVDSGWILGQVQENWAERWPRKSTEESM